MSRVLVTGATGFIGRHAVQYAVRRGESVAFFARPSSHLMELSDISAEAYVGDLLDKSSLLEVLQSYRPNTIIHLAGKTKSLSTDELFQVNFEGTRSLLQAASECVEIPRVLLVSSLAAAGPSTAERLRIETDEASPVSEYGKSKLAAEQAARSMSDCVPISIVRPPMVLGPGDRDGLEMYRAIRTTRLHLVPSIDPMMVSWIDVEDLIEACWQIANHGKTLSTQTADQGVYFVAGPETVEYGELGQVIAESLNQSVRIVRTPPRFVKTVASINDAWSKISRKPHILNRDKAREATAGSWSCSTEKLTREVGFQPAWSLPEAVRRNIDWYKAGGWLR